MRGGPTFLRHLLNAINALRQPFHKVRINGALRGDIRWWYDYMVQFNGTAACITAERATTVLTDACPQAGGAFCNGDFMYTVWGKDHPHIVNAPINYRAP